MRKCQNQNPKTIWCFSYEWCGAGTRACYELQRSFFPVQDLDLGQLGHEFWVTSVKCIYFLSLSSTEPIMVLFAIWLTVMRNEGCIAISYDGNAFRNAADNILGRTHNIFLVSFENIPDLLLAYLSNIRNGFYILLQFCH